MNARCAIGAVMALAICTVSFAADQQTVEVGSFVNTGVGSMTYSGPHADYVLAEAIDGHTVIAVDVAGILGSLGYDELWSITVTDNGFNAYGELSPGADIDLFRMEGAAADAIYSYVGPNTVHLSELPSTLQDRSLQLDSYSGAQDAWDYTHISLGQSGSVTAMWLQPIDLNEWIIPGGDDEGPGGGFGPGFHGYGGSSDSEGGDMPVLFLSEHGTFESFSVSLVASTIPAPGAIALLALAGVVGSSRRRK